MTSTMRFDRWEKPDASQAVTFDQLSRGMGLSRIIPSSVNVITSGSGSFNSSTGLVTFSATEGVRVRGVFSNNFTDYRIIVQANAGAGVSGEMRIRLASGGTDISTDYEIYGNWVRSNSTSGIISNGSYIAATVGWINTTSPQYFGMIDIQNPNVVSWTGFRISSSGYDGATVGYTGNATHKLSTAYDGFILNPQSGVFSGTIQVYGYGK